MDRPYPDFIARRKCLIAYLEPECQYAWNTALGAFTSDPAHVRTRRRFGDRANIVPLCRRHHQEQHQMGIKSFAAKYRLDLRAEAEALQAIYDQGGEEFMDAFGNGPV